MRTPYFSGNSRQGDNEVTRRTTAKPVRRRRWKKNSSFALSHSRNRHTHFQENKFAGIPVLASAEDK